MNQPGEIFYIRQLTRLTGEQINAVRRELERLDKLGAVRKEARANRIYYQMRRDYLFYDELLRMVAKTTGLGGAIIKNRNKIGKVKYAMISGKLIKNKPKVFSEVREVLCHFPFFNKKCKIITRVLKGEESLNIKKEELKKSKFSYFNKIYSALRVINYNLFKK